MSLSINHDIGAKRPYHGQRVCVEWQSPHFCRSTDLTSTGIKACSSSSVDGASVGTMVVALGLPNGWARPRTSKSTTNTARPARTTMTRLTISPPVRSQRWREDHPASRSSLWSLLTHSQVVQLASPSAPPGGPEPGAGCVNAVDIAVWKLTLPSTFCTIWWMCPFKTVTEPNRFNNESACAPSSVPQPHCG